MAYLTTYVLIMPEMNHFWKACGHITPPPEKTMPSEREYFPSLSEAVDIRCRLSDNTTKATALVHQPNPPTRKPIPWLSGARSVRPRPYTAVLCIVSSPEPAFLLPVGLNGRG